ncbi:MAG: InlB B-repeat-containing protein [Candidatus Hodarchaeales archaeon]
MNNSLTVGSSYVAKGEEWHFKVQPKDGSEFGFWVSCPSNVTIINSAPTASGLIITPTDPKTTNDLVASYTFSDVDSDAESGSEIIWYLDGVLQGSLNGSSIVQAGNTSKGEEWHLKIHPNDGTDFGSWVSCPTNVTIGNTAPGNTAPSASNLAITPSDAKTANDLTASYDFADTDSDSESGSLIRWYKNGLLQVALNDSLTVDSSLTAKGENWYFTIQPSDDSDYGNIKTSLTMLILNTAPSASNLATSPGTPQTTDTLTASYTWTDPDNATDSESGSIIIWYKDGYVAKGEEWHFKVQPKDGSEFGSWVSCPSNVTIINSAPTASGLIITPTDPKTTNDLVASYTFSDADSDTESGSEIIWYLNGMLQGSLNGSITIQVSNTSKGEEWHFKIHPNDGTDFGSWMSSPTNVTISNTMPSASNLQLTPSDPKKGDNLIASYDYFDVDLDGESGTQIRWYKNGILQVALNDLLTVDSSLTAKGENWFFSVEPFDGIEFGTIKTSITATIGNSAPTATNIQFSPASPTASSNLDVTYSFTDLDSDLQTGTQIRWYKNNIIQPTYNDLTQVLASELSKGDLWNVSIRVSDGTDYSEWNNASVNIQNSAPVVVEFSASIYVPTSGLFTSNNLLANWEVNDADGDSIVDFYIRWFKFNGSMYEIFSLENNTEVSPSYTMKSDEWRFRVQVFDGDDWSPWSSDAIQTIANSEPLIENITLSGGISTTNDIHLTYDYYDADNDSDFSTIQWKIVHLGSVNTVAGSTTLSNSEFTAGDLVWVVITPDDNEDTGPPVDSSTLSGSHVMKLVGDTAPQINTTLGYPTISSDHENSSTIYNPQIPIYIEYASLVYDIDSGESDVIYDINLEQNTEVQNKITLRVSGAQYRWYKYNSGSGSWELQLELTRSYVDPFYLHKEDLWMGSVRPRDQYGYYGSWVNSTSIEIGNSFPEVIGFSWLVLHPTSLNDLEFSFEYFDFDGDPIVESQTLILWHKNGILISDTFNLSILSNIYFVKGDVINVVIRPYDGFNWALGNYTSPSINIGNAIPSVISFTLAPTSISNIDVLALNWTFYDVDGDIEDFSKVYIRWYRNGLPEISYTNQSSIPLDITNNGDLWRAEFWISDGLNYSIAYTDNIFTKKLSVEYMFDLTGRVDPYNVRTDQFFVEDENISIKFYFDSEGDVLNSQILWFNDLGNDSWIEISQYENYTEIPSDSTFLGQKWKCIITPFDGNYTWERINSSEIIIESRPRFITTPNEVVIIGYETEGHYIFNVTVTDIKNHISSVEYTLNDTIGGIRYAVNIAGTNIWILEYHLSPAQFNALSNSLIMANVTVISTVNYNGQEFDIYQLLKFDFLITDSVAPRVTNAFFTDNSTSITFFAELEEFGSDIRDVNLYYYFEPVTPDEFVGIGSFLQQSEYSTSMILLNSSSTSSFFSAVVPFDSNGTNWKVIYRIETTDSVGNINPRAYDVLRDDPDSVDRNILLHVSPGLPEWLLLVAGLAMFLTFIGAFVYVKFIRKPELVGLDKELVMSSMVDMQESEVADSVDLHTIGVVISFFDQRHGPIPIIVEPEILRDNFTKLVELSDRSFSGTGFSDDFDVEITSSYDFVLTQGIRTKVMSFGYSLDVPEARGGQENITANILINSDLFPLVNQFLNEIQIEIHEIHLLMNDQTQGNDLVKEKVVKIRKFISQIILTYERIYGTTDLLEEETTN